MCKVFSKEEYAAAECQPRRKDRDKWMTLDDDRLGRQRLRALRALHVSAPAILLNSHRPGHCVLPWFTSFSTSEPRNRGNAGISAETKPPNCPVVLESFRSSITDPALDGFESHFAQAATRCLVSKHAWHPNGLATIIASLETQDLLQSTGPIAHY